MSQSSAKIKVGQLIKGLDLGGFNGGADRFGFNLSIFLLNENIQTTLIVCFRMRTEFEQSAVESLSRHGIQVAFLADWHGKPIIKDYYKALCELLIILKDCPLDILHCHFHIGSLMAIIVKLFGRARKIVRTTHVEQEWKAGWQGLFQQIIIRLLVFIVFPLFFDREGAVSEAAAKILNHRLLTRMMKKKCPVIYNAIDVSKYERPTKKIAQLSNNNQIIIGSIGRLTEQKGFVYFLEAVSSILNVYPYAHFWIIGEGPLENKLKTTAEELLITNHVRFLGKRDDISELLHKMNLLVLPSIYEGLPTVVLEGFAAKIPVIATDIPGTREIIQNGNNGWLVPPRNPIALAECILAVLTDKKALAEVPERAYVTLDNFRIEKSANLYAIEYRKLLRTEKCV